jgi:uncharacterized protein (DUF433 family)
MQTIIWQDFIHSDPNILLGKPVVKGTRISVELIMELFANGWDQSLILESYPTLSEKSLRAVFLYLNDCLKEELFFPVNKKAS